jgi:hypothetical protein
MSNHQFLLMWCNEGLEYVCDITATQQRRMWTKLSEATNDPGSVPNINHLALRARYNPQRHYEIYLVEAGIGITEDHIRDMFESDPQASADLIRSHGHCYYSDRAVDEKVRIR